MNVQKKVFAVAAAALIAANAGLCVSAAEWKDWGGIKTCEDGVLEFSWVEGESGLAVSCLQDDVTSIIIPESFDGKPVLYIPSDAFSTCSQLQTITIPNTIISCTYDAFVDYACTNLTDVYFGGTEAQWYKLWCLPEGLEATKENTENVIRYGGNEGLLGATIHFAESSSEDVPVATSSGEDVPVATPIKGNNGNENMSNSTVSGNKVTATTSSPKTGDSIWQVAIGAIVSLGAVALLRKKK